VFAGFYYVQGFPAYATLSAFLRTSTIVGWCGLSFILMIGCCRLPRSPTGPFETDSWRTKIHRRASQNPWYLCLPHWLRSERGTIILVLTAAGIAASLQAFVIQMMSRFLASLRIMAAESVADLWSPVVYVSISTVFAILCAALVQRFAPASAGSGLPEMRAILSGVRLPGFLAGRTLIFKLIGCAIATGGAGLFVGFLGPFVHVCVILCSHMINLIPWIDDLERREAIRKDLLSAACAAGIGSVLGSPLGGVLFSIESTATFYLTSNLWKCLYASVVSATVSYFLALAMPGVFPEIYTSFTDHAFAYTEMVYFSILGGLSGILSALSVVAFVFTSSLIPRRPRYSVATVGLIGAVTAGIWYFLPFVRFKSISVIIAQFFSADPLVSSSMDTIPALAIVIVGMLVMQTLSLSCPVPSGLFLPELCLGSVVGRLFGEVVKSYLDVSVLPHAYAVVGASALVTGITSSLSTSMILFEAMRDIHLAMPMLVAGVISRSVRTLFTVSFYDALIDKKGIPYIPAETERRNGVAADLMLPVSQMLIITLQFTPADFADLLAAGKPQFQSYPLVESADDMRIIGTVNLKDIQTVVDAQNAVDSGEDSQDLHSFYLRVSGEAGPSASNRVSWRLEHDVVESALPCSANSRGCYTDIPCFSENSPFRIPIHPVPFLVGGTVTDTLVLNLFAMSDISYAFVIHDANELAGVITKRQLLTRN
jgi:chloride channel 2